MIYKVGLSGVSGRMGLEIASLMAEGLSLGDDFFELSDAVSRSNRLVSVEGVPVRTWDDGEREPVHIWIDFSSPEGMRELLARASVPLVIGTTGLGPDEIRAIESYAKDHPVLLCPNTSLGMNWICRLLRDFPLRPEMGFQAVLEETHHTQKKDAPSGSAKRVLEALTASGHTEPQVHVTRAGDVVGLHRIRFIGESEEVTIEHRVSQRRVFARGALVGAQFLLKQTTPRVYRMEEVLG